MRKKNKIFSISSIVDDSVGFLDKLDEAICIMQDDGLDVEVQFSTTNDKLCALVIGRGNGND